MRYLPSSSCRRSWWVGWDPPGEGSCTQDIWEGTQSQNIFHQFHEEFELRDAPPILPHPRVLDLRPQSSSWFSLVHHSKIKSKTITLLCEWGQHVCRLNWPPWLRRPGQGEKTIFPDPLLLVAAKLSASWLDPSQQLMVAKALFSTSHHFWLLHPNLD